MRRGVNMTNNQTWIKSMDITDLSIISPLWTKMLQKGKFQNYDTADKQELDIERCSVCVVGEARGFTDWYFCSRCVHYATVLDSFSPTYSNEPDAFKNCLHQFILHFKRKHERQFKMKMEAAQK